MGILISIAFTYRSVNTILYFSMILAFTALFRVSFLFGQLGFDLSIVIGMDHRELEAAQFSDHSDSS